MKYIQDQLFGPDDLLSSQLEMGEYENCTFTKVNLNQADLSGFKFIDCAFIEADLTLIKLSNTLLRNVQFTSSKIMGVMFDAASGFGLAISFKSCILNNSSFYRVNLKDTLFINSTLKEVDFTESNLSNSLFDYCDLAGSIFDNTNLHKADLSTSFNYNIDLNRNKMLGSKHSIEGGLNLLSSLGLIIKP